MVLENSGSRGRIVEEQLPTEIVAGTQDSCMIGAESMG